MRGYTETLFGRRRPIPELSNSNFRIRQAGERQAMNAGIQGLAADIFKVALVRIDEALDQRRLREPAGAAGARRGARRGAGGRARRRRAESSSTSCASAAELDVPLEVNVALGHDLGRRQDA